MRKCIIILFLFMFFCSCQKEKNPIVARVGDRYITAKEFHFNYEFAPRSITQLLPDSARLSYLNRMVEEKLLAEEARRLELEKEPMVQRTLRYFQDREIIRELYRRHIRDSVQVDEEELREAFRRSKTILYVQHFLFNTEAEVRQFLEGKIKKEHVPLLNGLSEATLKDYGAVSVIRWNDLRQEVEDLLYGLPFREFSSPFYYQGKYHLFRIVNSESEVIQRESEFARRLPTLRSVIRKRKEHRRAFAFVQRHLNPEKLIIRADPLNQLTEIAWEKRSQKSLKRILNSKEVDLIKKGSAGLLEKELATFRSGCFTVDDFLFYYALNPVELSFSNQRSLRESIKNAVAIYVRDMVFAWMGRKEGLQYKPEVQREIEYWEDRILAQEMKNRLAKEVLVDLPSPETFEKIFSQRYQEFLADLRDRYRVEINYAVLSNLELSNDSYARKIDFVAFPMQ